MKLSPVSSTNPRIPVQLTEKQFNEFILKHIPTSKRGPDAQVPRYRIFNYILKVLYTGCQWKELPIAVNKDGHPEISYSRVFKIFKYWLYKGVFNKIFEGSVHILCEQGFLNVDIVHGDGTTTVAKRGGDCIGMNGHKKMKGEKVVAFVDRNCNVLSPFTTAPGNVHESSLFQRAFSSLKDIFKKIGVSLKGVIASFDSAYDSGPHRKTIFNAGMIPNIKENPRNRKNTKRGRKRIYNQDIFEERFKTVEHVFAWYAFGELPS